MFAVFRMSSWYVKYGKYGTVHMVRSGVRIYLLLVLMLSDCRSECVCSYVRILFSIVSNL